MPKLDQKAEKAKRKRIINAKECETELREHLIKLFEAFWNAVRNYEREIVFTPYSARCRGMEASYLNSKIIQSMQDAFSGDWKFGKYKRFILRLKGYIMFFKKLNSNDMPMNIPTKYSSSLQNQERGKLFDEYDDGSEPIVFFGYNKNRFGEIINPKLVYIDEDKVRFTITENDIATTNSDLSINAQPASQTLSIRSDRNKKEGTNN